MENKFIIQKNLNNLVNLFLDIAENNAERNIPMSMDDWKNEVETSLKLLHYNILEVKEKFLMKKQDKKLKVNTKNIKLFKIRNLFLILINY